MLLSKAHTVLTEVQFSSVQLTLFGKFVCRVKKNNIQYLKSTQDMKHIKTKKPNKCNVLK